MTSQLLIMFFYSRGIYLLSDIIIAFMDRYSFWANIWNVLLDAGAVWFRYTIDVTTLFPHRITIYFDLTIGNMQIQ